jgi:single-strand DNA-binding protein
MLRMDVIGFLGRDCILNSVGGNQVINFSVAHTTKYKDRNGQYVDKTTWVECAYWTDRIGIANYLKSGVKVFVTGTPDVRMWEKNGVTKATQSLRVLSVELLGSSNKNADTQTAAPSSSPAPTIENIGEPPTFTDDLPF